MDWKLTKVSKTLQLPVHTCSWGGWWQAPPARPMTFCRSRVRPLLATNTNTCKENGFEIRPMFRCYMNRVLSWKQATWAPESEKSHWNAEVVFVLFLYVSPLFSDGVDPCSSSEPQLHSARMCVWMCVVGVSVCELCCVWGWVSVWGACGGMFV